MRNLKTLAIAAAISLASTLAIAQTNPGLTTGQKLTAGQWNALFAGKQDTLGYTPMNQAGGVFSGRVVSAAPGASTSGFNLTPGSTPGSPSNGDLWVTASGLFAQVNGATIGPITGGSAGSFGNTSPITLSFPSGVPTYACPTCGVTGSPLSQFAATTSAQFRGVLSDETGTGNAVFGQAPTIDSPTFTTAVNATGLITFADLVTGTQDGAIGYWGSTTASRTGIPNCTGALVYSTSTHSFSCNTSAGTGTVTSAQLSNGTGIAVTTTAGANPCVSTCNLTIALSNAALGTVAAHSYLGNNTGAGAAPAVVSAANVLADIAALPLAGNSGNSLTGLLDISNAAAGQIKFPSTENPSADPNTLDDYREGTWTPTVSFGGACVGCTYSQNTGSYTKIGQIVIARFNITLSSKGSSTGGAAIAGLPFTPVTGLGGWLLSSSGMTSWAATYFDPQNTSIANINLITTAGTSQASNSNFNNTSALFGVIVFTAQ